MASTMPIWCSLRHFPHDVIMVFALFVPELDMEEELTGGCPEGETFEIADWVDNADRTEKETENVERAIVVRSGHKLPVLLTMTYTRQGIFSPIHIREINWVTHFLPKISPLDKGKVGPNRSRQKQRNQLSRLCSRLKNKGMNSQEHQAHENEPLVKAEEHQALANEHQAQGEQEHVQLNSLTEQQVQQGFGSDPTLIVDPFVNLVDTVQDPRSHPIFNVHDTDHQGPSHQISGWLPILRTLDFGCYKNVLYGKVDTLAENVTTSQTALETNIIHQLVVQQYQLTTDLDMVKMQLVELVSISSGLVMPKRGKVGRVDRWTDPVDKEGKDRVVDKVVHEKPDRSRVKLVKEKPAQSIEEKPAKGIWSSWFRISICVGFKDKPSQDFKLREAVHEYSRKNKPKHDCGSLRQSGPRPDPRLLRQAALEALTRSARTNTPRKTRPEQFPAKWAATAAARGGGGGGEEEERRGRLASRFRVVGYELN
ncbi:U-box domain-containing protein 9-like [Dorcoceras hygrometricum]|uniref:U-box domain-containing protein 9-like n=1 Tax=Dorcoceras hygrometricum TaxID=472368 RepID=A0A2Z7BVE6_9LAMI|nr:U-box domain-containing protein 9-like [Dorcoceras hygrometricum]